MPHHRGPHRVDPAGQVGKGHSVGSARTMVPVGRGGPDSGRGGSVHERPGGHARHRRTHRRSR